ncbi:MAG: GIY-YIG nuclease family protein [Bacteroidota bacterium]
MKKKIEIIVFILISLRDGRFYIGQTSDLESHLKAHNKGLSAYTKNFIPWEALASKNVETRSEAIRIMLELRNMKRKEEVIKYAVYNDFEIYLDKS